jgi:hypothetical protein
MPIVPHAREKQAACVPHAREKQAAFQQLRIGGNAHSAPLLNHHLNLRWLGRSQGLCDIDL